VVTLNTLQLLALYRVPVKMSLNTSIFIFLTLTTSPTSIGEKFCKLWSNIFSCNWDSVTENIYFSPETGSNQHYLKVWIGCPVIGKLILNVNSWHEAASTSFSWIPNSNCDGKFIWFQMSRRLDVFQSCMENKEIVMLTNQSF